MNSNFKEDFDYVMEGLEYEINKSLSNSTRCDFFIAILDSTSSSELFANERHLFCGTDTMCKKLFKESVKLLKQKMDTIEIHGNPKDDYIYIVKKI